MEKIYNKPGQKANEQRIALLMSHSLMNLQKLFNLYKQQQAEFSLSVIFL